MGVWSRRNGLVSILSSACWSGNEYCTLAEQWDNPQKLMEALAGLQLSSFSLHVWYLPNILGYREEKAFSDVLSLLGWGSEQRMLVVRRPRSQCLASFCHSRFGSSSFTPSPCTLKMG